MGGGGLPNAAGLHPRRLRPVAEPVGVFPLPIQQIQIHGGSAVRNFHGREGPAPLLDRLLEGEIRIHATGDIPGHQEALIPRLERVGAPLLLGEALPRPLHDRPCALLQGIQYFE